MRNLNITQMEKKFQQNFFVVNLLVVDLFYKVIY